MKKKLTILFFTAFLFLSLEVPIYAGSCGSSSPPTGSSPGGDHPDETFAVDSGFFREGVTPLNSDPDAVTFQNGYYEKLTSFFNAYKKGEVSTDAATSAFNLLSTTPSLIIPSGGLYGMENSEFFRATLDEYVKQGGTLIVFAQQRGYEYNILPTPDGKPVTGYGWAEDQACFTNGVYIDTWHQMLSGQSRSTPTMNVDGYFTGIPDNSTVLLRRTANGQPALIMYPHGNGRVIATTLYSDWAFAHGQASPEETALVRDMISWAKGATILPEISPGGTVDLNLEVNNLSSESAANIKYYVYDPDRKNLLQEVMTSQSLVPGESLALPFTYTAQLTSPLGIYHIDYELYDAAGQILQPRAENNNGVFAVINSPEDKHMTKDLLFSITTPTENVVKGQDITFTYTVWNNGTTEKHLRIYQDWSHRNVNFIEEITIPAGEIFEKAINASVPDDKDFPLERERFWLHFFEENGTPITLPSWVRGASGEAWAYSGSHGKGVNLVDPLVGIEVYPDKTLYNRGEPVNLTLNLQNKENVDYSLTFNIMVTNPLNSVIHKEILEKSFSAGADLTESVIFTLPELAYGGHYTINIEAYDSQGKKVGGAATLFAVPSSLISVMPQLPSSFSAGDNIVPFFLHNKGEIDVTMGILKVELEDPDGIIVDSVVHSFALNTGATETVSLPLSIPSPKLGDYRLIYSQSDETKKGRPLPLGLTNQSVIDIIFDKPFYSIRKTAAWNIKLINKGQFDQHNLSVAINVPDAGYSDTEQVVIAAGESLILNRQVTLPDTLTIGQYPVNIDLALPGGGSLSKTFFFSIPKSSLNIDNSEMEVTAGMPVNVAINNSGGLDAGADYSLKLYDKEAVVIAETTGRTVVEGGSSAMVSLSLPAGTVSGIYDLVIDYKNSEAGNRKVIHKAVKVNGLNAGLTIDTDKKIYPLTENITGSSIIINEGSVINGGNLHLQVTNASGNLIKKSWTSQYDFRQGTRENVDTYGVNDWLIPSDMFEGGSLYMDRWHATGNVAVINGQLLLTASTAPSYVESQWRLDGDFDVEADFSGNSSTGDNGASLEIDAGLYKVSVKNAFNEGYASTLYVNGSQQAHVNLGSYSQSGRLRIRKEGDNINTYYWNGADWQALDSFQITGLTGNPAIRLSAGESVAFNEFRVVTGRVETIYETVDSVRLLPLNDNFDDGIANDDRWRTYVLSELPVESAGVMHLLNEMGVGIGGMYHEYGLFEGDFSVYSVYRNFASHVEGRYFLDAEASLNNDYSSFYINRISNISRSGGEFIVGLSNVNGSYIMGPDYPYASESGIFRLRRSGDIGYDEYWNGTDWAAVHSRNGTLSGPYRIYHIVQPEDENIPMTVELDSFYTNAGKFAKKGLINLKYDSQVPDNKWSNVTWSSSEPAGTAVKVRTRAADTEEGLANADWSAYSANNNADISNVQGRWIEVEVLLETSDNALSPVLNDITVLSGREAGEILWEKDIPVEMMSGALSEMGHFIGNLGAEGKYFIQGKLTSSTGQTIAKSENAFYVSEGDIALIFNRDKRIYKPVETINITGQVINLSSVPYSSLNLVLNTNGQNIFASTIDIAESGTYLFNTTVIAGTEGTMKLTGMVTQNGSALADLSDEVTVSAPLLTAVLTAPDVVGSAPFNLVLELANEGLVDTEVQVNVMEDGITIAGEAVLVPAGELKRVVYERSIAQDMAYNVNITGELTSMLDHNVSYGEAATIIINNSVSPFIEEAGYIEIPVAINNTGQLGETVTINYALTPSGMTETKSYFLPVGATVTDTLFYNLSSGDYSLSATASQPSVSAEALLKVVNIDDAAMSLSHSTGTDSIININSELVNNGWNSIDGTVKISLEGGNGAIAWQGEAEVTALLSQSTGSYSLSLNPSAVEAGAYLIKGTLLNNAGIELASASTTLVIADSNVGLTAIPGYDTFIPGGEGTFAFTAMNSGGREGEMALSLKVFDVINDSKAGWLKAGEEKQVNFAFRLPDDLEEKDYFADYELKNGAGDTIEKGQVKFHLAGIDIGVNASLDKANYRNGETANLTFDISNLAPEMQGLNLFARVNYAGHEEQRPFVLNSTETLTFNVPLPEITGEKLFYGIYHGEGRSIHLNTLYIYKAGDVLTVMTDKQVYNPGETIVATITGEVPGLSGSMTLTGPDNFVETFDFSGSATRNILLPAIMKAGTYQINAQLDSASSGIIEANHPVDVNGIQVKVTEASLDKARYNATDTMNLDLQVESNTDITTDLKTWVIYPTGNNELVGGEPLALSSTEPVRISHSAPLTTEYLGIHRLVYGIYAGNLLLASGSEAFDVGSAVLNGVSTDKHEYANVGEPVTVSLNMYGTVAADIELYIDDELIGTEAVSLSGYETKTVVLDGTVVHPGNHILRAVLLSGELKSEKETNFKYGTLLPDLIVHLETSDNGTAASKDLNATVTNQGKTASTASSVAFYDRSPDSGLAIGQVSIAPLEAGESVTVSYSWSLLGKAGSHTLYALVDPENTVSEFIEFNNSAITTIQINDVDLKVSTSAESYEANKSVGIIKDVINFTAYSSLSNVTLQRKVSGPAGEVDSSSELIASLSPGEASYVDSWNTATSMPGSYNVEASLSAPVILNGQVTGEELLAADSTTFEVLPTISVAGAMTLSSNEVIQGFPLGINYSLINNGNMDVTGAELSTSVRSLSDNSSTVLGTFQIAALGVLESYSGLMAIDSVSVEPGDYKATLDLTADGKLIEIAEAGLIVKPPLRVEKMISTLPRVLVWTPLTTDQQVTTNEIIATTALSEMGAYYRIAHNENEFKEAMRSGYFNLFMLLETGKPTTGDLTAELTERVRGGSSLVLAGKSGLDDLKVQGVTGTKFTGYYMIKTLATTSISQPLFETPFNLTVDGKVQKLETLSNLVEVAATIEDKGNLYPSLTVNRYGNGMAVNFSFDLGISAEATGSLSSYIALLSNVVSYANPQPDVMVAGTVLPVEIKVESLGSAFDLKVREDAGLLTVLDSNMNGAIDTAENRITWNSHLPVNGVDRFMYLAALPDGAGTFNTSTEIYYLKNGEEKLYNSYSLNTDIPEGVAQLETNIVASITALAVSPTESAIRDSALSRFEALIISPNSTRNDLDNRIHELLKVIDDLEKLSIDATEIVGKLDDLLIAYERKWVLVQ